ncbi:PLP-dependent aminotransferase family protein [Mesorhizobium sp. LHD-90]|uniref:aminotransferase-like domain-containing protein n=1 Tax=Mesorhizobium sp. LHD-90 TaxID=3071414 RepID=UPI0027E13F9F|nr:PLP-dependent aminotransferase family protein [Mesorhizobium sp. LHD-90]MDQ6433920.1 PLP-dependent aminotransferase family protein [Mesorhizobium sp. LHD-90]
MIDPSEKIRTNSAQHGARRPAYVELASEFEARIRSGMLPPGSQLPAQRDLASERSLNVSTVTRAYRELQKQNLVIGSTRRGTIVTGQGLMPRVERGEGSGGMIDLTVNRPATDEFQNRLAASLPLVAKDPRFGGMQDYQPPEGPLWAREAGRRWIALNGFEPSIDDIVVTSGAQHALLAVVSGLINPGDTIVSDRLTYYGLKALAQMYRFRIIGVGSDEEGMSARELEEAGRQTQIKAVFVVPSMQNPMVVTMSEHRRKEIVEIAERHDFLIIEDDVYGPMLGSRSPAIYTMAPARTCYIAALSKAIAPGLRVGWLVAPPGKALMMAEAIRTTAWMPSPLPLLVASRWLEDGTAITILKAQLAELKARHALVATMLAGCDFRSDPSCMFIWLRLPAPWLAEDFTANVRAHGVAVLPSSAFACDRQPVEHAVRINVGGAGSRDELATALRIVATTLGDRPRALSGLA